jgi:hypothetical protein
LKSIAAHQKADDKVGVSGSPSGAAGAEPNGRRGTASLNMLSVYENTANGPVPIDTNSSGADRYEPSELEKSYLLVNNRKPLRIYINLHVRASTTS